MLGVFWLLNYNQNSSHPPGPHVTQGPGIIHQPRTDIGQSRSTGPHSTQGPYTRPGQTTVSPRSNGPPLYRRTSPSGGRTPARGRQRSAPGQLVPPTTERSAHQDPQSVPTQIVIRADPSVISLATSGQPAVPDPLESRAPAWVRPTTTQEMSLRSPLTPLSRSLAPSHPSSHSW